MKAQTQLRVCAYLLALLGLLSVTLTEYFSPVWPVAVVVMVAAGWFYEGPGKHADSYRRIWMALGFSFDSLRRTSMRPIMPSGL